MSNTQKQSILLVDADPVNQASVKDSLKELDLLVIVAESTEDVSDLVLLYDFALILFGVDPENLSPFETAIALNDNEKTWYVPIIFQAKSEHIAALHEQGYAAGGVDFLHKPSKPTVLLAKVKVFLELDARQQQLAFATA
ncbi:MAG TPA: response regulator, partial [Desulfobacterales bacterium]|nr:response regulator [Desulfobacterales bacterium]